MARLKKNRKSRGKKTEKEGRDYGKFGSENPEVQWSLLAQAPNWNQEGLTFVFYEVLLIYITF